MNEFLLTKIDNFQLRQKILEAHTNVKDLNLLEAKMNFIKAWQSLPDFGVSLFVVRFHGEKRDELLGVAYNRIMRMSLQTGDHLKTWRYNTIKVINFIFRNFNVKTMYCIFFFFFSNLQICFQIVKERMM